MNQRESHREIFCKRLKEVRTAAGLSQKKLGIAAGIDEFVAKTVSTDTKKEFMKRIFILHKN